MSGIPPVVNHSKLCHNILWRHHKIQVSVVIYIHQAHTRQRVERCFREAELLKRLRVSNEPQEHGDEGNTREGEYQVDSAHVFDPCHL